MFESKMHATFWDCDVDVEAVVVILCTLEFILFIKNEKRKFES